MFPAGQFMTASVINFKIKEYGTASLTMLLNYWAIKSDVAVLNNKFRMDPLQFAYRAKRGVEDATLTLFNLIASHLDTSGTTVRDLFMDFSSAFNTIQPHVLIKVVEP